MRETLARRMFVKTGAGGIATLAAGGFMGLGSKQLAAQQGITMNQKWQEALTPEAIILLAKAGNKRFVNGERIDRDYMRDVRLTKKGQHPAAAVLSCIDSRAPAEIIFDAGIGSIFNTRIAGNFVNDDIAGSNEFACKVSGAKLFLVMGHTSCGAIKGAIDQVKLGNLTRLLEKLRPAVEATHDFPGEHSSKNLEYVDAVATTNVRLALEDMRKVSPILRQMEADKQIMMVGAMYDVGTGKVSFLD